MYETEKSYIAFLCSSVGGRLCGEEIESREVVRP